MSIDYQYVLLQQFSQITSICKSAAKFWCLKGEAARHLATAAQTSVLHPREKINRWTDLCSSVIIKRKAVMHLKHFGVIPSYESNLTHNCSCYASLFNIHVLTGQKNIAASEALCHHVSISINVLIWITLGLFLLDNVHNSLYFSQTKQHN